MQRPVASEARQGALERGSSLPDDVVIQKRSPVGSTVTINNTIDEEVLKEKVEKYKGKNKDKEEKWQRQLNAKQSPNAALSYDEVDWYETKEFNGRNDGIDRELQKKAWQNEAIYKKH